MLNLLHIKKQIKVNKTHPQLQCYRQNAIFIGRFHLGPSRPTTQSSALKFQAETTGLSGRLKAKRRQMHMLCNETKQSVPTAYPERGAQNII